MIVSVVPYPVDSLPQLEAFTVRIGDAEAGVVMRRIDDPTLWATTPDVGRSFPSREAAVEALVAAWQRGEVQEPA